MRWWSKIKTTVQGKGEERTKSTNRGKEDGGKDTGINHNCECEWDELSHKNGEE